MLKPHKSIKPKAESVEQFKEQIKKLVNDNYPDIRATINSLQKNTIDSIFYLDEKAKKEGYKSD